MTSQAEIVAAEAFRGWVEHPETQRVLANAVAIRDEANRLALQACDPGGGQAGRESAVATRARARAFDEVVKFITSDAGEAL